MPSTTSQVYPNIKISYFIVPEEHEVFGITRNLINADQVIGIDIENSVMLMVCFMKSDFISQLQELKKSTQSYTGFFYYGGTQDTYRYVFYSLNENIQQLHPTEENIKLVNGITVLNKIMSL